MCDVCQKVLVVPRVVCVEGSDDETRGMARNVRGRNPEELCAISHM